MVGLSACEADLSLLGYRPLSIDPAVENLVKFAYVVSNATKNGRAGVAGRGALVP